MSIPKAILAAITHLTPDAAHSYRLQRVVEGVGAKLEGGLRNECSVQDIHVTLSDGYELPLRVFTPLAAVKQTQHAAEEAVHQHQQESIDQVLAELEEEEIQHVIELKASSHRVDEPVVCPVPGVSTKPGATDASKRADHAEDSSEDDGAADSTAQVTEDQQVADGSFNNDSSDSIDLSDPTIMPAHLNGTILFIHGGGWATGSSELYTDACANLAVQTNRRVISVDYRRAPDYKFPQAAEDCYEVARMLATGTLKLPPVHGVEQMMVPERLVVFGDSAGGNLTAAVSLMARDRGEFEIHTQMLLYPCLNNDYDPETSPFDSVRENGKDYMLTAKDMEDYVTMYLAQPEDVNNPYFAPLLASDFSKQPRTLIITAQYCPLRDEGETYARTLQQAGNDVECYRIANGVHGYFLYPRVSHLVTDTYQIICNFLDGKPFNADTEYVDLTAAGTADTETADTEQATIPATAGYSAAESTEPADGTEPAELTEPAVPADGTDTNDTAEAIDTAQATAPSDGKDPAWWHILGTH